MSVLIFVDGENKPGKAVFETVSYGNKVANGAPVIVVSYGANNDLTVLANYGATEILLQKTLAQADAAQLSKLVLQAAKEKNATTILFTHDLVGKAVAPRVAAKLEAGFVSGAVAYPVADGSIKVNVFSGKAMANVKVNSPVKVVSVLPNSVGFTETGGNASVTEINYDLGATKIKVKEVKKQTGDINLVDAELVVSAGRGLKGPENWSMIENLAKELGAATACSRPVSDIGWRPHHEHVGQTGIAIAPNLYIAVGISGAIQHLAGVNRSKCIVVINSDPEAPFFKAADYGIVGDAFDVVPKLIDAVKKFKASNN